VELAPSIRSALAGVRRRIGLFIWTEAVAMAIIWAGLTFWLALALDYFPVLVWASEMPRAPRACLLALMVAGLAWVTYRYLLRRVFVPISDRSLAVLLERHFQDFQDSLVTAVELASGRDKGAFNEQMLGHTYEDARLHVDQVNIGRVFNYRPLVRKVLLALIMLASIGAFYTYNRPALALAGNRLYLLENMPWPRSAEIEVVGIEIQHAPVGEGRVAVSQELSFVDRQLKVGRGASAVVQVRASAAKRLPENCIIYYRTDDGDRGSVPMKKVGRVKDGYQLYAFEGKPFKGMLADLHFDVMGFDHRVRDYRIAVVDSPALLASEVACVFPSYLVDEALASWLPRTEPITPATQLPLGTRVTIQLRASKSLQKIEVYQPATGQTETLTAAGDSVTLLPQVLTDNLSLELTLFDTDGVQSDRPQRLYLAATRDAAPRVMAKLQGIGSLVTPDVLLPVLGEIEDDYAVASSWFDLQINDAPPTRLPIALARDGKLDQAIDFRDLRSSEARFELKAKDKLSLVVVGQDKHNLEGGPHSGFGDRWDLVVVTPDELLSSLEARELGLRRRFEQIIAELTETRDELIRAASDSPPVPTNDAPTDEGLSTSLRTLIAQRAAQQGEKSAQEILGVAAAFNDIRSELINNRVDTEERKTRLKDQIADPLTTIARTRFPAFAQRLEAVEKNVSDAATAQLAVDEANELLLELDAVLQQMLDLETYNELVELVRSLIEEQEKLIGETKKQQAADLLK
jgi:hypothetical protein